MTRIVQNPGDTISRRMFHVGQFFIYLMASNLLLSTVLFLLGMTAGYLLAVLTVVTAALLLLVFYDERPGKWFLWEIASAFAVLAAVCFFLSLIYDHTCDGNWYHKTAIGFLRYGWNPVFQKTGDVTDSFLSLAAQRNDLIWIDAYGKQSWIFGATIYRITGRIESTKIHTILSMVTAFLLTVPVLRAKSWKWTPSVLLGIAAALNPVAIAQCLTFMVDGYLQIVLYIVLLVLLMISDRSIPDSVFSQGTKASLLLGAMAVLSNIKFTGLLYGGIFCIAFYLYCCFIRDSEIRKQSAGRWIGRSVLSGTGYLCVALICIGWAGYPTYIKNQKEYGTMTYPLTGDHPVDIMTGNTPYMFHNRNRLLNLADSLFSRVANPTGTPGTGLIQHKIPFTVFPSEMDYRQVEDVRVSGFGPLFSGLLLLSVLIIAISILSFLLLRRQNGKAARAGLLKTRSSAELLVLVVLLMSGLAIGIRESWWARYAPYLYFLVLTGYYVFLKTDVAPKSVPLRIVKTFLNLILMVLIGLNSMFFSHVGEFEKSAEIREQFAQLKQEEPVEVQTSLPGILFNFRDEGIAFDYVGFTLTGTDVQSFYYTLVNVRSKTGSRP